jgi:hypothetical protein
MSSGSAFAARNYPGPPHNGWWCRAKTHDSKPTTRRRNRSDRPRSERLTVLALGRANPCMVHEIEHIVCHQVADHMASARNRDEVCVGNQTRL